MARKAGKMVIYESQILGLTLYKIHAPSYRLLGLCTERWKETRGLNVFVFHGFCCFQDFDVGCNTVMEVW